MPKKYKFCEGENTLCQHKGHWYESRVVKVEGEGKMRKYHIHYCGFKKTHDEWVSEDEGRIVKRTVANVETMMAFREGVTRKRRRTNVEAACNVGNSELVDRMPTVKVENIPEADSNPTPETAVASSSWWNPKLKKPQNGSKDVNGSEMASQKIQVKQESSERCLSNGHASSMLESAGTSMRRKLRSSSSSKNSSASGTSHAASGTSRAASGTSRAASGTSHAASSSMDRSHYSLRSSASSLPPNESFDDNYHPRSSPPPNRGPIESNSASSGLILRDQEVYSRMRQRRDPIRLEVTDDGEDVTVNVKIQKCIVHDDFQLTIDGFVGPVPPPEAVGGDYTHYFQAPSTPEEWKEIMKGFERRWQFPNCAGAMDGKHIEIIRPANSGSLYYNYKGTYSIILFALVDHDYTFRFLDIGENGRASDSAVFRDSDLNRRLESNSFGFPDNAVIVGDDAFPLKRYLLKPYSKRHLTEIQTLFNYRLSRARRISENTVGILAWRFAVFLKPINLKPQTVDKVVWAACAIRNWLRLTSEKTYLSPSSVDNQDLVTGDVIPGEWRTNIKEFILNLSPLSLSQL